MNKLELIESIIDRTGLQKKAAEMAVSSALETITEALASGDTIKLVGFGSFAVKERSSRVGRNPRTGEAVAIPASRSVAFKAGKVLREAVTK